MVGMVSAPPCRSTALCGFSEDFAQKTEEVVNSKGLLVFRTEKTWACGCETLSHAAVGGPRPEAYPEYQVVNRCGRKAE
jgi:hypothetical protein